MTHTPAPVSRILRTSVELGLLAIPEVYEAACRFQVGWYQLVEFIKERADLCGEGKLESMGHLRKEIDVFYREVPPENVQDVLDDVLESSFATPLEVDALIQKWDGDWPSLINDIEVQLATSSLASNYANRKVIDALGIYRFRTRPR